MLTYEYAKKERLETWNETSARRIYELEKQVEYWKGRAMENIVQLGDVIGYLNQVTADRESSAELPLDALEEFNKYKDLEEHGKLLKLPCAVGDTVYTLNTLPSGRTVVGETVADAFFCAIGMLEGRFGKTIFLAPQEAEAALKEL